MKVRLTAQGRILDRLSGYTTGQVTEHLARAIHDLNALSTYEPFERAPDPDDPHEIPEIAVPLHLWDELPEELKESIRAQVRQLGELLAEIGCVMIPAAGPAPDFSFDDDEAISLARLEHERWLAEQPTHDDGLADPDLVPWDQLSDEARTMRIDAARRIPAAVAGAGFEVLRDSRHSQDGAGEADFTAEDWTTLQQAMMASGVLVGLSEGTIDAEEMFVLVNKLRQASIGHPSRLIRELTAASSFNTGLRPGVRYADYRERAVQAIRAATDIVARTAATELAAFRTFLVDIAVDVAEANLEGGFLGIGAHRRSANEVVAIEVVRSAASV